MIRARLIAAVLLLCFGTSSAMAEITFYIEEPPADSNRSGLGLISGWAVSDVGIESVEVFVDGESLGFPPYGSRRGDVERAFPDIPNSGDSGWAMKWAWSLHDVGEHTLRAVVTEVGGATASKEVTFNVVAFHSAFISNPADVITEGATLESTEGNRIVISGAQVEGEATDIELLWDKASQQFLIDAVRYGDEEPTPQKAPTAYAPSNFSVDTGASVNVSGEGTDPDGFISSHGWSQVSGPAVSLQNADQWTASFTAPQSEGTIRLRLLVTDDDGLSDTDDVLIEVVQPEPPNQAPQAQAGSDFTVEVGEPVQITGNGTDSDGQIIAWKWSRVGGASVTLQNSNSQTVSFTAPASEGYTRLRLLVTDDDGATGYDVVQVNFHDSTPANQSPTANAGPDKSVNGGDAVTVTGSASDPDGTIESWAWTQIGGIGVDLTGADGNEVSFTAPDADTTIRLRLTVTDNGGATDSDEVSVSVKDTSGGSSGGSTTEGNTLFSMLDDINAARGTARPCEDGGPVLPAQPPLEWSESLADIAMQHSMEMAYEGYFSHNSFDGSSMGSRVFPYWSGSTVGENIATSTAHRSDAHIVQGWIDSPGHCALLMSPDFTHAGVGFGYDLENGWTNSSGTTFYYFWTLNFGG